MTVNGFWRSMADSWATPTGAAIVIAGIIWLVQLNFGFVTHQEKIAAIQTRLEGQAAVDVEHAAQLGRVALILDSLERRMAAAEKHVVDHEQDADGWKHRIIQLEERVKNR